MDESIEKKTQEIKALSENIKETLHKDLNSQKDRLKEIDYKELIMVGAATAIISFSILKLLFGKKKDESEEESVGKNGKVKGRKKASRKDSYLLSMIKEQIALILVSVAREKLIDYLDRHKIIDGTKYKEKDS